MKTTDFGLSALSRRHNRILRRLNRQAHLDRCKGDIVTGWDWPTLRIVHPVAYAQLMDIKTEAREARKLSRMAFGV